MREVGLPADSPFPEASCPENCQAIGQVTGFQVQLGTNRNPFLLRRRGKIVAFTIRLGRPNADQIQFFTNLFGGRPQVRLALLKGSRRGRRYRLKAQSEVFNLAPYYGSSPTFALDRPLQVEPNYTVALTVPTWAPAFTVNLGADQAWRSSRARSDCADVSQPAAQQTVNSLRTYRCFYRTARLLYSATFIPDPRPTAADDDPR